MPITPKRLPFFDHIAELRRRIVVIAVTVLTLSMVLYTWGWQIYDFVLAPVLPLLTVKPQVFTPFGTFGLRFQVAFYASLVVGAPIIIWQIMAFFLPALKEKERRYVIPTITMAVVLFLGGVAFCYTIILGPAFTLDLAQGGTSIGVIPDAQKFFQGVIMLLIGFGIGFELPIIVFYLVIFNIVPYAKLRAAVASGVRGADAGCFRCNARLVAADDGRSVPRARACSTKAACCSRGSSCASGSPPRSARNSRCTATTSPDNEDDAS